jgi:tetratricopeptide (TPR) repeat protein
MKVLVVVLLSLSGLVVNMTNSFMDLHRTPESSLEETFYLPSGSALRTASLGFTSLLADVLWIKTILYYGRHTLDEDNPFYEVILDNRQEIVDDVKEDGSSGELDFANDPKLANRHSFKISKKTEKLLYGLLQRVVELEPHFMPPYEFGSLVVTGETHNTENAVKILEIGMEQNPERWELPYYFGYLELFHRGDNREAFRWLSRAMALPGSPPFLQHLYYSYLKREGGSDFYVEYLRGLHETTQNEEIRKNIRTLIERLKKI